MAFEDLFNECGLMRKETLMSRPAIDVWVIDDNEALLTALSEYVDSVPGFQCKNRYFSAKKALDALKHSAEPPALFLVDIQMPDMNGLDAIVPFKQAAPKSMVFMITGMDSEAYRRVALARGADGFIAKFDLTKKKLEEMLHCASMNG